MLTVLWFMAMSYSIDVKYSIYTKNGWHNLLVYLSIQKYNPSQRNPEY